MKRQQRPTTAIAFLVLAAAFVLAARWLAAGPDAEPPPGPAAGEAAQTAPASTTPLPDFKPSEELPADAAVAFPTDI